MQDVRMHDKWIMQKKKCQMLLGHLCSNVIRVLGGGNCDMDITGERN